MFTDLCGVAPLIDARTWTAAVMERPGPVSCYLGDACRDTASRTWGIVFLDLSLDQYLSEDSSGTLASQPTSAFHKKKKKEAG